MPSKGGLISHFTCSVYVLALTNLGGWVVYFFET